MDNTKANSSSFDEQKLRKMVWLELSKLESDVIGKYKPQPSNSSEGHFMEFMTTNESLNKGDMAKLNSELDFNEIMEEAHKSIEMTIEKDVRLSVRKLLIKAKAIILDDTTLSLDERTEQACDVYRNVIEMAKEIGDKEGIPTVGVDGNYRKIIVWDNKKLKKDIAETIEKEGIYYLFIKLPELTERISEYAYALERGEGTAVSIINIIVACVMQDKFEEVDKCIDKMKIGSDLVNGPYLNKFEEMGLFTDEQKEYINKKREELK
jgi:hypothetical protein